MYVAILELDFHPRVFLKKNAENSRSSQKVLIPTECLACDIQSSNNFY